MVAITTFATGGRTMRADDELTSNDPVVKSHATYFACAGTPRPAEAAEPAPVMVATPQLRGARRTCDRDGRGRPLRSDAPVGEAVSGPVRG